MKTTRVLIRNLEIMGKQNKPRIISRPEDCQSMSGNQTIQSRRIRSAKLEESTQHLSLMGTYRGSLRNDHLGVKRLKSRN